MASRRLRSPLVSIPSTTALICLPIVTTVASTKSAVIRRALWTLLALLASRDSMARYTYGCGSRVKEMCKPALVRRPTIAAHTFIQSEIPLNRAEVCVLTQSKN